MLITYRAKSLTKGNKGYGRSILDLAILFYILVPLTLNTWLTAVKHEFKHKSDSYKI
jgi:hypothetical protein